MVRTLNNIDVPPERGDITKELVWPFDVGYGKIRARRYEQLLATLRTFSTIVPSYVVYVKYSNKFWGLKVDPSLPLALLCPKIGMAIVKSCCTGCFFLPCNAGKLG